MTQRENTDSILTGTGDSTAGEDALARLRTMGDGDDEGHLSDTRYAMSSPDPRDRRILNGK